MIDLARLLQNKGDSATSSELYSDILARQQRLYGEAHMLTLHTLANLADVLMSRRNFPAAEVLYRQFLALEYSLSSQEVIITPRSTHIHTLPILVEI